MEIQDADGLKLSLRLPIVVCSEEFVRYARRERGDSDTGVG